MPIPPAQSRSVRHLSERCQVSLRAIHLSRPSTSCFTCRMAGGWVYMMANRRDGVLYVGVTSLLPKRAYEHREGLVDGFTKQYGLKMLVYYEHHDDIRTAIQREKT